ncbi:MAG: Re/Si-specific NAD(P)(+) transhydrogenase subunit alpha [Burkholderiales bacterium]|jgi:NAD(P) transhydrogenase subunit alpha|nr:Re/Si-specific NAD(P)(+) transhydrogenase subunit alpha [Burkholderiales bacterium]
MLIGIPLERHPGETRVAVTPETVKKLLASGAHTLVVERGAGLASSFPDAAFEAAGAKLGSADEALAADIVLKVRGPDAGELAKMKKGALLVGLLNPFDTAAVESYTKTGMTAFALEKLPRISRAQSMDVLSSQANIAGYKSVILGANEYGHFMPMLMTAAGTVKAARLMVLGVGVAGLQAIATAKRLGAVVEASDVRPSVKDQVESLGAKWVDVPYANDEERQIAEGVGGYARPMPPEWMARQAGIVHERALQMDIVITTALIPGRPAPKLIKAATVAAMKPGSVLIDLAAEQGGNVEGCEAGKTVNAGGVKIVGCVNLAATVPADASALYARNVFNFLALMIDAKSGAFALPEDDEIIQGTLLCKDGAPFVAKK